MKFSVVAAACVAALSLAAPAAAANLLINGGFEGAPANNNGTYYRGPLAPAGWARVSGLEAPDILSDAYGQGGAGFQVLLNPQEGDRFLDMNGASPTGGLQQDVTGLNAGDLVTLTWWAGSWAQNSSGVLAASLLDASNDALLSGLSTTFDYLPGATSSSWTMYTLTAYVPTSGSVRVRFTGDSASVARGAPGLDNVSLAATPVGGVPEPGTWALMIAGFGLAGGALRRTRRAVAA
jgi:hypothetical protein